MLRLGTNAMAAGDDGKRLVWAMVNSVLMSEASGKGFAVQRNVMMRIGGRGSMSEVLTKRRLRQLLADEHAAKAMVYNLQSIGRSVRSTPMQWSGERHKMEAAIRHIANHPPWVQGPENAS